MEKFECYFQETICLFSDLSYSACSGTDLGLVFYAKTVELPRTPFLLFAFSCFPESEDGTTVSYALFWFGSIASLFLLVAGFLASNTQLYESIGYVTIGITVFLYFLDKEQKRTSCLWKVVVFAIIGNRHPSQRFLRVLSIWT